MNSDKKLEYKIALITGASSGIGRAIATQLGREGISLSLLARRKRKLEELAEKIGNETDTLISSCDVREENQVQKSIQKTIEEFDSLDIVICNAGVGAYGKLEDMTDKEYQKIRKTNMDGVFFTVKNSLPPLKKANGNLIFMGSFSGKYPRKREPTYAASKWWVRGFSKSLSAQLGDSGVSVSLVNPSEIRTEIRDVDGRSFKEIYDKGEIPGPESIGKLIVWLIKRDKSVISEIDFYRKDKISETLK